MRKEPQKKQNLTRKVCKMNLINIPCSVHFDLSLAQNADPLQPDSPDLLIKQLKATRGLFRSCTNTINADPFLFVHNGKLYLFYEEMGKIYTPGKIMMTSTSDLKDWTEPQNVLSEPYHFSYPFVFEAEGRIWMMPECWQHGGIPLYSASDDTLLHWKFEKLLISGNRLVDSSVCFRNGLYYLHSCSIEKGKYKLLLFTAEHLFGPWREHPCSPIAESRNGGALFERNGKLYRFAQRNNVYYGNGLDLWEIQQMTAEKYEEKSVKEHFIRKGHHYSIADFYGKTITARTHAFLSFMLPEFFRRIFHYVFPAWIK